MDFITGLPKSQSHDAILVLVDHFTKYMHFLPLSYPYSGKTVAAIFVKEMVRLHEIPKSIVNGRDSIFFSNFWTKLFRLQGTRLNMSTTYHPETNGNIEVLNRGLQTYLRCFAFEQLKQGCSWLHWTEYWYKTSYHSAAQSTSFELVYDRPPPTFSQFISKEIKTEEVG